MRLVLGGHNLKPINTGSAVSIGNFDGVHLGHQHVIKELVTKADTMKLSSVLVMFEPQPQEYFAHEKAPVRLSRLREKISVLKSFGLDMVLILPFNRKLAQMSHDDFIEQILIAGLKTRFLVVGDDFCFGKNRTGNFATLQQASKKHGFLLENMASFVLDAHRVSSTIIRRMLADGNLTQAATLLGRDYQICGRVVHGQKRGRTIGFPTANIHLHRLVSPLLGVFVVRLYRRQASGSMIGLNGVANIGTRPTLGRERVTLEVHLFDFDQNMYGEQVSVDFFAKIRDEQKFPSLDDLRAQIVCDCAKARDFFANYSA